MFKRLSALLWLRFQIIFSNKSILLQILMPFAFVYFYKYLLDMQTRGGEQESLLVLAICLPFSLAMAVGNPITVILSEEKEKKNLRTLLVSGVKRSEYLASTLILPFFLTLIIMGAVPLILDISIDNLFNYSVVVISTSIVIILLYLFLGLVTRTQVEAQIVSIPVMLLVAFLPMLSNLDQSISKFVDYSFMGLFTEYLTKWKVFSLGESVQMFMCLIIWIIILIFCNYFIVKKKNLI